MRRPLLIAVAVLALAACSSGSDQPASQTATTTATAAEPSAATFASAGGSKELVEALAARISQVSFTKAYTAEDDENHLLGRPGGYIGKASFADSRVKAADRPTDKTDVENGGGVEVFADAAGAQARKTYIDGLLKGSGGMLGTEYLYVSGTALLRVSGNLTPTVASEYEKAWPEVTQTVLG